jgi:flagellar hook-associated protein 3 FlgL
MSTSIGSGFGILSSLIANASSVHQQLDTLTEQVSTGLVSQTYAGLGSQAGVALNLNPQLTALQTYQTNIGQASGGMQLTQTTMTQIQQIASTFAAAIPNLNGINPSEVDSVAAQANAALKQLANLLNTQNGGSYVFAGQDTGNPPVPTGDNILSSGFYTQIKASVSALSTNGATATAQATLGIASSNTTGTSPFSAYLSQSVLTISATVVQTGEGGTVQTGLLASGNSAVQSSGTSTTGSYMRDLMRSLATLGSLSSSQVNDPGFAALVPA